MTESAYRMLSFSEAKAAIAEAVRLLPPVTVRISDALGLVLAEDILAPDNLPPFPASSMDGYAVIASDRSSARRVIGEQTAGQSLGLQIRPGTAMRIMTGAPLPAGADAVIPVESAVEEEGMVRFLAEARQGQFVRPVGQDLAAGDVVLELGQVLGPAEIGLLATAGRLQALAHPMPRVAVMATGDELVSPDQTPGPGQIRDSNSYALLAAVEAAGCEPIYVGRIRDDEAALRSAILSGLERADVLITSGGVSMGTKDYVKPILEELGEIRFGRVAIKPGKPLTLATALGRPVLGLPGFPVSSLVSFEVFVRPALRRMGGHRALERPRARVRLAHRVRHDPDRMEFQRAVVTARDGVCVATTTGVQVSSRLESVVGANALLILPQGVSDLDAGQEVDAMLITLPEVAS